MSLATEQQNALKPEANVFALEAPYLLGGKVTVTAAETDSLRIAVKIYAEGGENVMHHHINEDHSFIVLEGQATFRLNSEDNAQVVGPHQGVMIPSGADYCFTNTGDQNLVMIRIAAFKNGPLSRTDLDPQKADESRAKQPRILAPERVFGPKS